MIMAVCIPDIVFYTSVELSHTSIITNEWTKISFAACLASLAFMMFDLCCLIWPICEPKSKKYTVKDRNGSSFEYKYENSWRRFSLMNYKHVEGQYSKRMLRSVNPLFFLRFVVSQLFIALLQEKPQVQAIALASVNILYTIFLFVSMIKHRATIYSKTCALLDVIVELCLMVYFGFIVFFAFDPMADKFSSVNRHLIEIVIISCVLIISAVLGLRFVFGTIKILLCMEKKEEFVPINELAQVGETARSEINNDGKNMQDTVLMTHQSQNYSVNRTLNSHHGI